MREIVLVRHAESTYNVAGRWQGQGDAPLSERGRAQAAALGRRLGAERFDRVIASDLSRASDTAATVGDVTRDAAWRELDVGAWEGLTREEVDTRYADEVAALQRGEPIRVGGGESWADLRVRALAALDRLRGAEGRTLVVTHGGVILTLVSTLLGVDERRPRPIGRLDNTAVTRLRFVEDRLEIAVFNDTTHLGPVGESTQQRLDAGDFVARVCAGGVRPPHPPAESDLSEEVSALATRHPGRLVDLEAHPERCLAGAVRLLGEAGTARLAQPLPGCVADLVVSRHGVWIAAWNLPR